MENAIYCTLTNIGLRKSQEAANNTGYYIRPLTFGVSSQKGIYSSSRDNTFDMWYTSNISNYEVIDSNTLAFYCDIPEDAYLAEAFIHEIYLFAKDYTDTPFLLCLGQVNGLKYIPGISIQLKIIISILQFDILSTYKFEITAARDIEQHNNDPNAHADVFSQILSQNTGVVINNDSVLSPNTIYYCETDKDYLHLTLPATASNGDSITVIDFTGTANENPITVSSNTSIDGTIEDFILNTSGAKVVFFYNSKKNIWNVDIAGRLNNKIPQGFNPNRNIYYTDYFTSGISVYNKWTEYRTGEFVIHENKIYRCKYSNNSDELKIPGESNAWEPIAFGYARAKLYNITKNTPCIVPPYIKGSNMLKVYVDGLLCNSDTYYEDTEVENGNITNTIYFLDDIPEKFSVEAVI